MNDLFFKKKHGFFKIQKFVWTSDELPLFKGGNSSLFRHSVITQVRWVVDFETFHQAQTSNFWRVLHIWFFLGSNNFSWMIFPVFTSNHFRSPTAIIKNEYLIWRNLCPGQKNSWNQINQHFLSWNCIFGSFPSSKFDFWPLLNLQKMESGLNKPRKGRIEGQGKSSIVRANCN